MSEKLEGNWTLEQRVQIAKDVIARLNARSMIAVDSEGYLTRFDSRGFRREDSPISGALHSDALGVCEVCARGALFLCAVDRYNSVTVDLGQAIDALAVDKSHEGLGSGQARDIETAFECWDNNSDASAFGDRYADPRDRLIAICQNMIDNGGLFIPPAREDRADYDEFGGD